MWIFLSSDRTSRAFWQQRLWGGRRGQSFTWYIYNIQYTIYTIYTDILIYKNYTLQYWSTIYTISKHDQQTFLWKQSQYVQCNACKGSYNGSQGNMFMEAPPATHSVCKGHNGSDNGAGQDSGGDRKEVLDNCFVLAPLFLLSTTLLLLLLLSVPPSISAPSLFSLLFIWYCAAFSIFIGVKADHCLAQSLRLLLAALVQFCSECWICQFC